MSEGEGRGVAGITLWGLIALVGLVAVTSSIIEGISADGQPPFLHIENPQFRASPNWASLVVGAVFLVFAFVLASNSRSTHEPAPTPPPNREISSTVPPLAAAPPIRIRLHNPLSVDVASVRLAIEQFGSDWPSIEIDWSPAGDRAIGDIESALRALNEWPDFEGRTEFTNLAPRALAEAAEGRQQAPEMLRAYVARLNGFGSKDIEAAVISYLRLLNFSIHHGVTHHLGWRYLNEKGYLIPEVWRGILDRPIGVRTAKLIGPDDFRAGSWRAGELAVDMSDVGAADAYSISGNSVRARVYGPLWQFSRSNENINTDREFIAKWLCPQVALGTDEYEGPLGGEWRIGDAERVGPLV